MKIIGLTGGIGTGKSTVLQLFENLGAAVYIADVEAKKLMNSNEELIIEITKIFGENSYVENKLNTAHISSIVFNNKQKLNELNGLVHPKVRQHFKNFIKNCKAEFVIYEAAILFESGSDKLCDYIITVTANFDDRIERIIKRDGVSKKQILDRMQHQLKDDFKIKNSHFVIKNNQLLATKAQVKTIFDILLK
jgi:dephospho-CoA kinase